MRIVKHPCGFLIVKGRKVHSRVYRTLYAAKQSKDRIERGLIRFDNKGVLL